MVWNTWYPILEGRRLKRGRRLGITRLDRRVVLWRGDDGRVTCLPDRCPHRGGMLSRGKLRGGCLECPYHGLRFDRDGRCVLIPANGAGVPVPERFNLSLLPVREEHGLIWLWHGDDGAESAEVPWLDGIPELKGAAAAFSWTVKLPWERVMENLLDVHHLPFVHRWTFPGVGPRVENLTTEVADDKLSMNLTMRHEAGPGFLRPDWRFVMNYALPGFMQFTVGGLRAGYAAVPVDAETTLILGRYDQSYLPGFLGGRALTKVLAWGDLLVFALQDVPTLRSQVDTPGIFSDYRLYEADRAIGLFFGLIRAHERDMRHSPSDPVSAHAA